MLKKTVVTWMTMRLLENERISLTIILDHRGRVVKTSRR